MVGGDAFNLQDLVKSIEDLSETEMEELFKILHLNKCEYTKNNNGIFINLSWQSRDIIQTIEKYIHFCQQSRKEVSKYQTMCDELKPTLVAGGHPSGDTTAVIPTENLLASYTVTSAKELEPEETPLSEPTNMDTTSRVSSSMKFYLLKKKYAKMAPNDATSSIADTLRQESYLMN